jgi:peptidoglycan glycosyltransferase
VKAPLRRVALVVLALFAALFVNLNLLQVVRAEGYRQQDQARQLIRDYSVRRGSILAADGQTELATVQEVEGDYRFPRFYPQGPLYGHITGYLSPVFDRTLLERQYDEVLSGSGNAIDTFADLLADREPVGDTIVTTIDPVVQQAARDALGDRRGAVAAIDPGTGAILALYSNPTYDPNELSTLDGASARAAWDRMNAQDVDPRLGRAAQETFAPGSTFKIITAATALEAGMPLDRVFDDPGEFRLPGTQTDIPNFGGGRCNGGQPLDLARALQVSCNTAFAQLGSEYNEQLVAEAQQFGFTTDLGGQLPWLAESAVTDESGTLDPASAGQAAIGQLNVRATPLQMAAAAGAIGAGGVLRVPRLVNSVQDYGGAVQRTFEPVEFGRPVSPTTATTLTQMMVGVVEDGTGQAAQIDGVTVAGKTGTAQRGEGQNPNVWFVGFAPAENPTVAVAVIIEDGAGVGSEATGGRLAAPAARQVLQAALERP